MSPTSEPDLAAYCLMLGDDALIMSHRLQEWCTMAPELEDEVALANIALDLLGQARVLLTRAGSADGSGRSEDYYAYFRGEDEFRNVWLAELRCTDFGQLTAALLVFATWRLAVLQQLTGSSDDVLAGLAAKAVKEVTYHRDYAARWVIRLGDGTAFSRERMLTGLAHVWPYVPELFVPHEIEQRLAAAGIGADPAGTRAEFDAVLAQVCAAATLEVPESVPSGPSPGRDGVHTKEMGPLLAELQGVARDHRDAAW
jgi:ring-1,2-phenylacetyl-CoA epoxidase subunit PaaC